MRGAPRHYKGALMVAASVRRHAIGVPLAERHMADRYEAASRHARSFLMAD